MQFLPLLPGDNDGFILSRIPAESSKRIITDVADNFNR